MRMSPKIQMRYHILLIPISTQLGEILANELPGTTETPESCVSPSNSTFQIQNVSEVDVFQLLTTLKISKSCGHDKIPPKLLKDSAIVISTQFLEI